MISSRKIFEKEELHEKYEQDFKDKKIRYVDMKKDISEVIYETLKPIQAKRKEIEESFDLDNMILEHTKICREVAIETLAEVKQKMGLI